MSTAPTREALLQLLIEDSRSLSLPLALSLLSALPRSLAQPPAPIATSRTLPPPSPTSTRS